MALLLVGLLGERRAEAIPHPTTEHERIRSVGKQRSFTVDLAVDAQHLRAELDVLAADVVRNQDLVAVADLPLGVAGRDGGRSVDAVDSGLRCAGEVLSGQVIGQRSRAGGDAQGVCVSGVGGRAVKVDGRAAEEKPVDPVSDLCREDEEVGGTLDLRSVDVSVDLRRVGSFVRMLTTTEAACRPAWRRLAWRSPARGRLA